MYVVLPAVMSILVESLGAAENLNGRLEPA